MVFWSDLSVLVVAKKTALPPKMFEKNIFVVRLYFSRGVFMKRMTEQHLINALGGESQVPINLLFISWQV
ncbi:hypothetical protein KsCSTR_12420 [Candidatus Kuenenia stuttgartiensis]|jgi:hypothetical protein|nr:hypothetical protein [Candidatus Kuenenia stuttgartiensis]QII10621.1 hypothetical protein KsCSTR_12420 [Candidatus Kuenenia stuttgartiensis]SOH03623.1 hypothetical protein KSMBR1_1120 [Candidatus Kuenenia stuttgartiensis]